MGCCNSWANLRCSSCSPLGEKSLWNGTIVLNMGRPCHFLFSVALLDHYLIPYFDYKLARVGLCSLNGILSACQAVSREHCWIGKEASYKMFIKYACCLRVLNIQSGFQRHLNISSTVQSHYYIVNVLQMTPHRATVRVMYGIVWCELKIICVL